MYCYTMTGTALATIYPTVINSFSINLLSKREREREKKKERHKERYELLLPRCPGGSFSGRCGLGIPDCMFLKQSSSLFPLKFVETLT